MAQARIAGISIPQDKKVKISLTYVYGIGKKVALDALVSAGVDPEARVKDLSDDDVNKVREIIEKSRPLEGDLRREISSNIKRLKEVNSWRGNRHTKGLPVRGQSTKNNNRTVRGNKRGTATSGKKPVAQKT